MSDSAPLLEAEQKELLRVLAEAARADRGRPFFCGVSQARPAYRVVGHTHLPGGQIEVLAAHLDYFERNLGFIDFPGDRRSLFNVTTPGLAAADAAIAASASTDSLPLPDDSASRSPSGPDKQTAGVQDSNAALAPSRTAGHRIRNTMVAIAVTVVGGLVVLAITKFVERTPVYREATTKNCGVDAYVQATGPVCGTVYNQRRDALCGVELFNMGQTAICGVDEDPAHRVALKSIGYPGSGHKTNFCRDRGFAGHNGKKPNGHCLPFKRCRDHSFGVDQFLLCRREEFGVEKHQRCSHESFGVERWKTCRHESHGVERFAY